MYLIQVIFCGSTILCDVGEQPEDGFTQGDRLLEDRLCHRIVLIRCQQQLCGFLFTYDTCMAAP